MTERIKELAEQASHQSPDGYPVTIPYSKDFAEKFAELIVQEFEKVADELKAQFFDNRKQEMDFGVKTIYAECESACDVLKSRVKKHFGIEE